MGYALILTKQNPLITFKAQIDIYPKNNFHLKSLLHVDLSRLLFWNLLKNQNAKPLNWTYIIMAMKVAKKDYVLCQTSNVDT